MRPNTHLLTAGLLLGAACWSGIATAVLPPPTPEQARVAAEKKAKADEQAAKEKQELLASMDAITARWRSNAAKQGLPVHPPIAVAAAPAAVSQPATGSAPAGQPGGKQGPAVANAPIRSEKRGTAPPSSDVKKAPTQPQPPGTPPTVNKGKGI